MPPEPLVLAFDTSAAHCAAALLSGNHILAETSEDMATGQAERLLPMLETLLAGAGADWQGLSRIGVGIGPGNFTGVRIAVAAARGLALGLGIPAVGVTVFEALAEGQPRPVTVAVDARRGQVYLQRFADDGAEEPVLLAAEAAAATLAGETVIGPAALLFDGRAAGHTLPLAVAIARIAASRSLPRPRPAPFYLRAPDAALPADPPPVILDA